MTPKCIRVGEFFLASTELSSCLTRGVVFVIIPDTALLFYRSPVSKAEPRTAHVYAQRDPVTATFSSFCGPSHHASVVTGSSATTKGPRDALRQLNILSTAA